MEVRKHDDCKTYILLDDEGAPVTSAVIVPNRGLDWLCFVNTRPAHRRQGYARDLILYIQEEYNQSGEMLYLIADSTEPYDFSNDELIAFYKDLGFSVIHGFAVKEVAMVYDPKRERKEMTSIDMVAEFHRGFGFPHPDEPTTQPLDINNLRLKLIEEELDELARALDAKDQVGILDALCDLRYVLDGAAITFGMAGIFDEAFKEVHRSNMTKACRDREHAEEEVEAPRMEGERIGLHWVYDCGTYSLRNRDGKLVKPSTYEPADLSSFFPEKEELSEFRQFLDEIEATDGDESGARD